MLSDEIVRRHVVSVSMSNEVPTEPADVCTISSFGACWNKQGHRNVLVNSNYVVMYDDGDFIVSNGRTISLYEVLSYISRHGRFCLSEYVVVLLYNSWSCRLMRFELSQTREAELFFTKLYWKCMREEGRIT